MTKLLIGLLGAGVLATGGWAAATGLDSEPARTVSLPGATTSDDTTTGATTTGSTTAGTTTARTTTDDISGPCDEAEHRTDPRCTGAAADDDHRGGDDDGDDDNSGRGSGGGDDEDRSGSNSGRG
jgi:hypothetical protein